MTKSLRERESFYYLNQWQDFFFFALSYSAHLSIDVHCSKSAKTYNYSCITGACFLCVRS